MIGVGMVSSSDCWAWLNTPPITVMQLARCFFVSVRVVVPAVVGVAFLPTVTCLDLPLEYPQVDIRVERVF